MPAEAWLRLLHAMHDQELGASAAVIVKRASLSLITSPPRRCGFAGGQAVELPTNPRDKLVDLPVGRVDLTLELSASVGPAIRHLAEATRRLGSGREHEAFGQPSRIYQRLEPRLTAIDG